jgi:hypothetical protein
MKRRKQITHRKPNGYVRISIEVPAHTATRFKDYAASLKVEQSLLLTQALYKMLPVSYNFDLDTVYNFGKYEGETLQRVIEMDRGYVHWCLSTINGFKISDDARVVLNPAFVSPPIQTDAIDTSGKPNNPFWYQHKLDPSEVLSWGWSGKVWAKHKVTLKFRFLGYYDVNAFKKTRRYHADPPF